MKDVHFSKKRFNRNANEILDDIEKGKFTSKSWIWVASGAVLGFLSSCIKLTRKTGKPILAKFGKLGNKKDKIRRF